jgi:hypothetical protein
MRLISWTLQSGSEHNLFLNVAEELHSLYKIQEAADNFKNYQMLLLLLKLHPKIPLAAPFSLIRQSF